MKSQVQSTIPLPVKILGNEEDAVKIERALDRRNGPGPHREDYKNKVFVPERSGWPSLLNTVIRQLGALGFEVPPKKNPCRC